MSRTVKGVAVLFITRLSVTIQIVVVECIDDPRVTHCSHATLLLSLRERANAHRTLRRQDKKMKELVANIEDERKMAESYKTDVSVGGEVICECGGRGGL